MSDFFGDDFTIELKKYFLESLDQEIEKFQDLLDEKTFKRVLPEVREQIQSWVVDARTNEFMFLATWLELFIERSQEFKDHEDLKGALKIFRAYVEALSAGQKDSEDLSSQFSFASFGKRESLYLHCRVGEQDFVVPIQCVIEISGQLPLFPLPQKQSGLLGVVPFRGEALPVFDLTEYGFEKFQAQFYYYVICEFENCRFALQVSQTDQLISVSEKELQTQDSASILIPNYFIQSFFIRDDKNLMVLDLQKLVAA